MLHAEFSLAPLLFLAAFAFISSLSKRKKAAGTSSRPAAAPGAGFMSELRRAMEELQQAQQQATSHSTQTPQSPQTPQGSIDSWQASKASLPTPQTPQERIAAQWLAKQKARKALKPTGRVRSVRAVVPLEDDDADKSSETVVSLEGRDYDEEAEQIIARRREAAEHRVQRVDESSEDLSLLQQARRASRPDVAIGGAAEHAAWHGEIGSVETVKTVKTVKTGKLAKYADGTARSAIILGEILQPPVGQRNA